MKIVITIATLDPRHGGPARTVPALCRALVRHGVDLELITIAERGRRAASLETSGFAATIIETDGVRYHPRAWAARFKESIVHAVRDRTDALIYDVGLWLPSNHFAAKIALEAHTPLVVSPRGMLGRKALEVSKWKKRVAWILYQRNDLKRARLLHATSVSEAQDFREGGLSQPIAVVPNGVDLPSDFSRPATTNKNVRTLLFLSRLHPIKGLRDLVEAWARVRPKNWRVVIAGPNENNHQQEIESLSASLGVREDIEFVGSVDDRGKWKLLAQADLFVLPSHSESFGLAIAEALAAGLPVITTRATPWKDLVEHRCGWWEETGVDGLTKALSEATMSSIADLHNMGTRGRALMLENYTWEKSATKLLSVFEWLIGSRSEPSWLL